MRFAVPFTVLLGRLPRTAVATAFIIGLSLFTAISATADIPWQTDLKAAHATAQSQNKPLLLHFTSDNCVWCDRLEAGAFQDPQVQQAISSGFVPVKVLASVPGADQLVKMFKVKGFPTDVIVWPTGQTLSHSVSPQKPGDYLTMLASSQTRLPASAPPNSPNSPTSQTVQYASAGSPNPNVAPVTNAPLMGAAPAPSSAPDVAPGLTGGASAHLAGVRTDGMSLGGPAGTTAGMNPAMPAPAMATAPNLTSPDSNPSGQGGSSGAKPQLAMEGFCSVTVIDEQRWAEGNPQFGVIHLGRLFLFESRSKMETFLADPTPYTPVLNGIDVVRFFEERRVVPGKRQFGVQDPVYGRMFFFADEAALNHFDREFQRYVDAAIEVMDAAVADANP